MSRQLPLNTMVTTVLDGDGNGSIGTGPLSPGETWTLGAVAFRCSSNNAEATCLTFVGGNFAGGSTFGSTGDSGQAAAGSVIGVGTVVEAQWSGGDPGAIAYLTVTGQKTVG